MKRHRELTTKERIGKFYFFKVHNFSSSKDFIKRVKRQARNWKKIRVNKYNRLKMSIEDI